MFINLGWIPGYLQTCGQMLHQHYKNLNNQPTIISPSIQDYFEKVIALMDNHPKYKLLYSDLNYVSKIMAECQSNNKTAEECFEEILKYYDL